MRKFAHTMLGTLETWTSRLGKIAFSDLKNVENFHSFCKEPLTFVIRISKKRFLREPKWAKNYSHAENLLTRTLVQLKRGFHKSEKSHFHASKVMKISTLFPWKLKLWFYESAEIAFFGCQNALKLLTRSLVHAENLLTQSLVPFQCGFHETAKRQFNASKMRKFPHSFRGTNKSHFRATKMRKIC